MKEDTKTLLFAVAGLFILYKGFQFLKSTGLPFFNSPTPGGEISNDEIEEAGKPTYLDSQFEIWADQLAQAFFDLGTDEKTIFGVYDNLRNDADLLKLHQVFGVRTIYSSLPFMAVTANLSTFIADEMSAGDIKKLNDILKKNGLNSRY